MDIFKGKRKMDNSPADPEFLALAFHLAGASAMAAVVLDKKEDLEVQEVGRVLGAMSSRFFDLSDIRKAPHVPLSGKPKE